MQNLQHFFNTGLSITASSRDERLIPSVAKVLACRLESGHQLRLWFHSQEATEVLAHIARGLPLAVTACLPSTNQTIQMKARFATVDAVQPDDFNYVEKAVNNFADEIASVGHPRSFAFLYHQLNADLMVAVVMTVDSWFEQSPGPEAGRLMETEA